jgi:hypothetical protein
MIQLLRRRPEPHAEILLTCARRPIQILTQKTRQESRKSIFPIEPRLNSKIGLRHARDLVIVSSIIILDLWRLLWYPYNPTRQLVCYF